MQALRWRPVRRMLLGICLALAPLFLPPYVLLEICDWLPVEYEYGSNGVKSKSDPNESHVHLVDHYKKIMLINGVHRSVRTILERREAEMEAKRLK